MSPRYHTAFAMSDGLGFVGSSGHDSWNAHAEEEDEAEMKSVIRDFRNALGIFFLLSISITPSQSQFESLTIGIAIQQLVGAGHELIDHGSREIDEDLILAGNIAISVANALESTYRRQLDNTFGEINDASDELFDELRILLQAAERPLEHAERIVIASGVVASRLPMASKMPAVISTNSELVDLEYGHFELAIFGINLDFGELTVESTYRIKNLEIVDRISSFIRLSGTVDTEKMTPSNGRFYRSIPLEVIFVKDRWFWQDEIVEFTVSLTAVSWQNVQARVIYNQDVSERTNPQTVTRTGRHGRVSRSASYSVSYVPVDGRKIDPSTFQITSWRVHSECSSSRTYHNLVRNEETGIVVHVHQKEEGGLWKECGTSLTFKVDTYQTTIRSKSYSTEWQQYYLWKSLTYPEQAEFIRLELKLANGSTLEFNQDLSPVSFLRLVNAKSTRTVVLKQR